MDLALLKNHVYVNENDYTHDVILTQYAAAAETYIENYLHHDYDPTNKIHTQAALLLAGSWFVNRENETTLHLSQLPFGVKELLSSDMSVCI